MNKNYPICVIIVLTAIGGQGLISLKIEQVLESINLITLLIHSLTPLSLLLQDSLKLLQLETGISTLFLEVDYKTYGLYMTKS